MRGKGDRIWVCLVKAWVGKLVGGQREGLALGVVFGSLLMLLGQWVLVWSRERRWMSIGPAL